MGQAASLWVKLGLSDKEFDQGLKRAENRLKRFGDRLSTLGSRLTMGFSAPLALASGGAIKLAADLEQTKIAFEVMTGSAEKATRMVENLQKMGAKTPYESKDLLESAKTLMLFGVEAEKVEGTLQMLGDVASGSSDKLKSLSLAFAQVQSTGRLTGQDLLQMINAGFNPLQIISEKTGKSMAELKDQMSKGAISADAVTKAFKIATSEGGRFFGMMDKQSGTTLGKFSTLMDNMKLALTNIGTALLPFANKLMEMLMPMTEQLNDLSDAFLKMPQPIQNVVVGTVAFAAALGPVLLITGKLITSFSALLGVLRMLPLAKLAAGFSSITFAVKAVAGGAATASEALGMLSASFTPFLAGGAIMLGLFAIVKIFQQMRTMAKLAQADISKMNDVGEIQESIKVLQNRIKIQKEELEHDKKGLIFLGNREKEIKRHQDLIDKYQGQLEQLKKRMDELLKPSVDTNTDLGADVKKTIDELMAAINSEAKLEIEVDDQKLSENIELIDEWGERVKGIVDDVGYGMEQSLSDSFFDVAKGKFDSFGDYFQNFCDSILRAWSRMLAQAATQRMMSGAFGNWMTNAFGGGGTTGGMVGDFPTTSNFGGYCADGGPVVSGRSYIVGEKGPELFTPSSSGTIIPNNALGGSNVTVQVVNPPGIPLKAKTSQPKFDGKQMIVSVMLEAINNNTGGIRDALGTVR
jgi:tape measure domain-containing protein